MLERAHILRAMKRLAERQSVRLPVLEIWVDPNRESFERKKITLLILASNVLELSLEARSMLHKMSEALEKQGYSNQVVIGEAEKFHISQDLSFERVLLLGSADDVKPQWFRGDLKLGPSPQELMLSPQKKRQLWSELLSWLG